MIPPPTPPADHEDVKSIIDPGERREKQQEIEDLISNKGYQCGYYGGLFPSCFKHSPPPYIIFSCILISHLFFMPNIDIRAFDDFHQSSLRFHACSSQMCARPGQKRQFKLQQQSQPSHGRFVVGRIFYICSYWSQVPPRPSSS
jgi:hypothetical protein